MNREILFGGYSQSDYNSYLSIDTQKTIGYFWTVAKRVGSTVVNDEYINNGVLLQKFCQHKFDAINHQDQQSELEQAKEILEKFKKCKDLQDSPRLQCAQKAIKDAEKRINNQNNNLDNNNNNKDDEDINGQNDNKSKNKINNNNKDDEDINYEHENNDLNKVDNNKKDENPNNNINNINNNNVKELDNKNIEDKIDNDLKDEKDDSNLNNNNKNDAKDDDNANDNNNSNVLNSLKEFDNLNHIDDRDDKKNEVEEEEFENNDSNNNNGVLDDLLSSYSLNPSLINKISDANQNNNNNNNDVDNCSIEDVIKIVEDLLNKNDILNLNIIELQKDTEVWKNYRNNLKIVLNSYRIINNGLENGTLNDYAGLKNLKNYIENANRNFLYACMMVTKEGKIQQSFEELSKSPIFSSKPPKLTNGVVFCSKDQYLMAASLFEQKFPVLTTNFDIPELDIYQSYQIMIFFRCFLVGPEKAAEDDLQDDGVDLQNLICIRSEEEIKKEENKEVQGWAGYLLAGLQHMVTTGAAKVGEVVVDAAKAVFNGVVNAASYPFSESENPEDIKWKIIRFESLNSGVQALIKNTVQIQSNQDLHSACASKYSLAAMSVIKPLLDFSMIENKKNDDRFTVDYMDLLRKQYNTLFIDQLRQASKWSENILSSKADKLLPDENSDVQGAYFIDALCYKFFTELNLNECCGEVVSLLEQRGKQHNTYTNPRNFAQSIDFTVKATHERIHSLDSNVRGSVINQQANSLRGHVRGIPFVTPFDPNRQSNFPQHLYSDQVRIIDENGKEIVSQVRQIAMGSPTIEYGGWYEPEIDPLFIGYLRHCQKLGLVHVYNNFQNLIPKSKVSGDESACCNALIQLAEGHFKGTLHIVTYNEDALFVKHTSPCSLKKTFDEMQKDFVSKLVGGEFDKFGYKLKPIDQIMIPLLVNGKRNPKKCEDLNKLKNYLEAKFNNTWVDSVKKGQSIVTQDDYDKLISSILRSVNQAKMFTSLKGYKIFNFSPEIFKKELSKQIFRSDLSAITGNYISPELVKEHDLLAWGEYVMNQIHQHIFDNKKKLNLSERRIFIRLFEFYLSEKVKIVTKAHAVNDTCKDGIDRGIARKLIKFVYRSIIEDRLEEPKFISFLKTLIFSRAAIVRKRAILEHRLEPGMEVVDFMLKHQEKMKLMEKILFPNHQTTMNIDGFSEKIVIE